MEIQKATGIVLSSRRIGEADCLCTIYTKEFGKRDFIFKGLQKSKRRSRTISEPGTTASLVYYFRGHNKSYITTEYSVINHPGRIREDLKKIYLLYFLTALIEKTTGYDDKNKLLFDLAAAGIDNIQSSNFPGHLSVFFLLRLLKLHGILPDFHKCKICDSINCNGFFIDTLDFHPVCGRCISTIKNKTIPFDKIAKQYIHESLTSKFVSIDHSKFPSTNIINLLFSITLFIENYYHIEIKPKDLLITELSYSE